MTREEAISYFEKILAGARQGLERHPEEGERVYGMRKELSEIALAALRPVSREQVERMRGEWVKPHWRNSTSCAICSQCGFEAHHHEYHGVQDTYLFCPRCMAPMTDEAVEILMKRLEKMHETM